MINNCIHNKIGYLIQDGTVKEICDECSDVECIESHKLILKEDLNHFITKTLPLVRTYYDILFEQLPTVLESLKITAEEFYQHMIKTSSKITIQRIIDVLETKEGKDIFELIDFYLQRDNVKLIQEKLDSAKTYFHQLKHCILLLQPNDQQEQTTKTKQKLMKFKVMLSKREESIIKQININCEANEKRIEKIDNFEIPTKFKFKRLYSITWLQEKYLGIAAGENHPYIIYDPVSKIIQQQIALQKTGIYDSIEINNQMLVVGDVFSIRLFHLVKDKYVADDVEFEQSQSTPSRLYYCKITNSVFSTNNFNQLSPINYVNQWFLETGRLFKYQIHGRTYGALCIVNKLVAATLWVEGKNKCSRKNFIYLWEYDKQQHTKQIETKEPVYSLIGREKELIGFGQEIYIWTFPLLNKVKKIKYPEEQFNFSRACMHKNTFILGCDNGSIWVTDDSLSCWEKVLKMRSKVMKISDQKNQMAISSYDCSFCIFQLKN